MTPAIETKRLRLRVPDDRDSAAAVAYWMDARSQFTGGPLDEIPAWRHWASVVGHWTLRGYGLFAVEPRAGGASLGLVGCYNPGGWPEPEIGWILWSAANEGQGLAHEAASAARDWAWSVLGWRVAVSYIAPENDRSIALAERLGAVRDDRAARPKPEALVFRHWVEAAA